MGAPFLEFFFRDDLSTNAVSPRIEVSSDLQQLETEALRWRLLPEGRGDVELSSWKAGRLLIGWITRPGKRLQFANLKLPIEI